MNCIRLYRVQVVTGVDQCEVIVLRVMHLFSKVSRRNLFVLPCNTLSRIPDNYVVCQSMVFSVTGVALSFVKFRSLASVSSNKVGVVVACSFEKMRSRYLYSSDKMSGVSKSVVLVLSKSR